MRRTLALGAELGAQLRTHWGTGRLGGHRREWHLLAGLTVYFALIPLTTVRCPGDKPFLERLRLVGMQPQPPSPPAADKQEGQ